MDVRRSFVAEPAPRQFVPVDTAQQHADRVLITIRRIRIIMICFSPCYCLVDSLFANAVEGAVRFSRRQPVAHFQSMTKGKLCSPFIGELRSLVEKSAPVLVFIPYVGPEIDQLLESRFVTTITSRRNYGRFPTRIETMNVHSKPNRDSYSPLVAVHRGDMEDGISEEILERRFGTFFEEACKELLILTVLESNVECGPTDPIDVIDIGPVARQNLDNFQMTLFSCVKQSGTPVFISGVDRNAWRD